MLDYYKIFLQTFWKDFKKSTGEQVIGALLAISILALQIHYGVIKQGEIQVNFWSVAWPYAALVCALFLYHLIRAPWELHQKLEQEIDALTAFKKEVEDKEVELVLIRCNYVPNVIHIDRITTQGGQSIFRPLEKAESVTVTFGNPRKQGMPGKIAENVLARVRYTDSTRSFEQDGRWNQLDQPAGRDFSQSTLDLLRITFSPGDERHLDIAAKFASGLFAYNNESQRDPQSPDKLLTGSTIYVTVELLAHYVGQTFEFELKNPLNGPLDLVPMPEVLPAAQ